MTTDPCEKCGQAHTRCKGHNRAGGPCGRSPAKEQRVCNFHGAASSQAKRKAEERATEKEADDLTRKIWPGLGLAPTKDPVDLLARVAAALEHMVDVVGERVNELNGRVGGGKDLTQLRAEVTLLDRLMDKLLKASEGMARLGIAERHVELEQERAAMVTTAFLGAIAVLQLLPADKELAIRTFLDAMPGGSSTPPLEVA